MSPKLLSAIKVSSLALVLTLGIPFAYAWVGPTAQPPTANVNDPINIGATAQTKAGGLTAGSLTTAGTLTSGGVTTGTLKVTGGTLGVNKVLTSDVSGNATWQTPAAGSGDNLGNHTATQALNMGTNNILGGGANSTYGALTIQGAKNTYSGIQFKDAAGTTNYGTLMMHPSYSGFFNATDNNWRMYVTDGGASALGTVVAQDFLINSTGKYASTLQSRITGTCAGGQAVTAINADGTVMCGGPTAGVSMYLCPTLTVGCMQTCNGQVTTSSSCTYHIITTGCSGMVIAPACAYIGKLMP